METNKKVISLPQIYTRSGLFLVMTLLLLGLFFRIVNLDNPVYWVDEVATSIRVAGYTRQQVIDELADGRWLTVADLQHYQRLTPQRDWSDTLAALQQSPEHAPLYFVLARLWSQLFGSSVAAVRSLSVVLSLLALPCMMGLSRELFGSGAVAAMSMSLLAVSPFFVAYAQEARPYSLWTLLLLLNGWLLLRSLRHNQRWSWLGYGITATLSLYTSLLSGLVLLGQAVYVVVLEVSKIPGSNRPGSGGKWWRSTPVLRTYLLLLAGAIVAFVPWLWVIAQHWDNLQDNTTWTRTSLGIFPLLAIWLYNTAILYFDVPVVVSPIWVGLLEILLALIVVSLIGFSIYFLCANTAKWQWLFVLSLVVAIPGWLMFVDLVRGNQLSTAVRYMVPSHLGIQLAMAYWLVNQTTNLAPNTYLKIRIKAWKAILLLLITLSLISCLFQLWQPPKYQKSRNLHNQPIASILNQANSPVVWTEAEQTIDLISLSYMLKSETQIRIFADINSLSKLDKQNPNSRCQTIFVFNPSSRLQNQIQSQSRWQTELLYQPQRLTPDEIALSLWSIVPIASNTNCSI